jgi:hypothetical protein
MVGTSPSPSGDSSTAVLLKRRGVMITSKAQPCELMRRVALPLQKKKVIPKEEIDGEVEECEGGGTRKTTTTIEEKAEKKKGTTTVDGGEGDEKEKEKEKGEKRTDEKMMSATAMERAYVKNFSADKFWFSIDGKVHNGKALKKAIPLGTFFEFAKEGLTRDTWKHLENEGKAKSLIRTVPDKCPNKELYAEFVLLRLVEVCEVAQTTKKGWTDKGWAQCRFELVPMFGSHLREGERDELVLNILVEAAFHRLRVSKLAPSDGTGIKIHMRYDGFRSPVGHRLALEDGVSDGTPDMDKQQKKIEEGESLTKNKMNKKRNQASIVSTKGTGTAKVSQRSRKSSLSKGTKEKERKRASPVQKRRSPPPPPVVVVVATDNKSRPSLTMGPHSSSQEHSKEGGSTNCLKSSFGTEAGPGTAAAAAVTAAKTMNRSKYSGGNRIEAPSILWDLSDGDDHNEGNTRKRAIPRQDNATLFETTSRRLADRIDFSKKKRPTTETENERENSPKKPRTPANTILEPSSPKGRQDMKDVGDSAYQTVLRAHVEKTRTKASKKNAGDAKNSNGSNLTEQFDNSLDFDKSTEENDDDDDAKGESTEEDIIETDVEDHHALNKRRQPSLASQQELAREKGEALCGRGAIRIHTMEEVLGRVEKKPSYARRPSIREKRTQRDQLPMTKKVEKEVANLRSKHRTARKIAKPYHNRRKSPPLPEKVSPILPIEKISRDDVAVDALLALNGNTKASYETTIVNNSTNTAFSGGAKNIVQVGINDAVQYSDAEHRVQIQTDRLLFFESQKNTFRNKAIVRAITRRENKAVSTAFLSRGFTVNMDSNEGAFIRNMLEFANMSRLHMDAKRVLWEWKRCLDELPVTKTQRQTMEQFVSLRIQGERSKWPNKEIRHFDSFLRNDGEYWNLMTVEKCETVAEIVAYRAYERALRTPEMLLEMKVLRSLVVEYESDLQRLRGNADILEQIRYDYNTRILKILKDIDKSIY